jgi:hypothetical protein
LVEVGACHKGGYFRHHVAAESFTRRDVQHAVRWFEEAARQNIVKRNLVACADGFARHFVMIFVERAREVGTNSSQDFIWDERRFDDPRA